MARLIMDFFQGEPSHKYSIETSRMTITDVLWLKCWSGPQESWVQILALPQTPSVTLGKSPNLSVPQLPGCKKVQNYASFLLSCLFSLRSRHTVSLCVCTAPSTMGP